MLFYRAALPLSRQTATFVSTLIRAHASRWARCGARSTRGSRLCWCWCACARASRSPRSAPAVTNPSRGRRPTAPMPAYAAPANAPTPSSRPGARSASRGAACTELVVWPRPFTSHRTASSPPDEKAHGMGTALLMRLSGLVFHHRRRTFGSNGSGVSRGDPQPQHPIDPNSARWSRPASVETGAGWLDSRCSCWPHVDHRRRRTAAPRLGRGEQPGCSTVTCPCPVAALASASPLFRVRPVVGRPAAENRGQKHRSRYTKKEKI